MLTALESQPQHKLDLARQTRAGIGRAKAVIVIVKVDARSNHTKPGKQARPWRRRRRPSQNIQLTGITQLRAVENIECFSAELKVYFFGDFCTFRERHIRLPDLGRPDDTPERIPKPGEGGCCKRVDVDPIVTVLPAGDDRDAGYQVRSLIGCVVAVGNLARVPTDKHS